MVNGDYRKSDRRCIYGVFLIWKQLLIVFLLTQQAIGRAESASLDISDSSEFRREGASLSGSYLGCYRLEFLQTNAQDLRRQDYRSDGRRIYHQVVLPQTGDTTRDALVASFPEIGISHIRLDLAFQSKASNSSDSQYYRGIFLGRPPSLPFRLDAAFFFSEVDDPPSFPRATACGFFVDSVRGSMSCICDNLSGLVVKGKGVKNGILPSRI